MASRLDLRTGGLGSARTVVPRLHGYFAGLLFWPVVALVIVSVALSVVAVCLARRWWRLPVAGAMLILAGGLLFLTNWSLFAPHAYFAFHRASFDAVAASAESGQLADADFNDRVRLPGRLQTLSSTGTAGWVDSVADASSADRVFLVPEWTGYPDGAAGYIYIANPTDPDLTFDLNGNQATLRKAVPLGGGWWWTG